MNAIAALGLIKDYANIRALAGVNLEVDQGEIFGFLGPNGAGKTTFVKIILGMVHSTGGSLTVLGHLAGDKNLRSKIGYLPENMRLHGFLKGHEFLDLAGKLYGLSKKTRKNRIEEYLKRVSLEDSSHRPLREYSKGMLQRIGIAQALIHDPEILIFDEPTSGLDPIGTKDIRDIIISEKKRGKTIFLNSHLLSEVERTCDRVAILNRGAIVKFGKLDELSLKKPTIRVEVEETSDKLQKGLSAIGENIRISGNAYYLVPKDRETRAAIPKVIVDAGARMVSISEEKESLEDIFYRVVKGDK